MAVTNNIREIREQRGIYQDDLAAAIGFSTKTVGRIERGDSTPSAELCYGFLNTLIYWWKMSSMQKIELGRCHPALFMFESSTFNSIMFSSPNTFFHPMQCYIK